MLTINCQIVLPNLRIMKLKRVKSDHLKDQNHSKELWIFVFVISYPIKGSTITTVLEVTF